jgi:CBS domain-containing protein
MMFNTVASLLKEKTRPEVVTVTLSASVAYAVQTMNEANVGAVLVMDDQKMLGIFTERDVLVRVVGAARDPETTQVSEVMTAAVYSVELTSTVDYAMQLMSARRHRHLPVLEKGQVRGMVSMGDVTRWCIRSQQEQVDAAIRTVKQFGMSNRRA